MLQLHLIDQQFYCLLGCVLYFTGLNVVYVGIYAQDLTPGEVNTFKLTELPLRALREMIVYNIYIVNYYVEHLELEWFNNPQADW